MAHQSIYFRLTLGAAVVCALLAVSWTGLSSTAKASILLPEGGLRTNSTLNIEQLIVELEEPETSSSGASTRRGNSSPMSAEDAPTPSQEDLAWQQLAAMMSHTEGSSSGTSSSSSSTGSIGSGASLLLDTVTVLSDNCLVDRYATELSLLIPDAPGNELLRPPRG